MWFKTNSRIQVLPPCENSYSEKEREKRKEGGRKRGREGGMEEGRKGGRKGERDDITNL